MFISVYIHNAHGVLIIPRNNNNESQKESTDQGVYLSVR